MSTVHVAGIRPESAYERRWAALGVLLLAYSMNLLDATVVTVALPSIAATTGAGFAAQQWVVAGYLLALAVGLLPGGRLGDRFGHRQVFIVAVGAFTLASLACAVAADATTLVVARFCQGAAAAAMVPQVMAIIHLVFPEDERGMAFGLSGAVAGLSVILGPVVGGGLIALDIGGLGWRWIFLVNLPIGVFAVVAGRKLIPASRGSGIVRFDWLGAGLGMTAVILLAYPLIVGSEAGWSAPLIAALLAAPPILALFALWQRHRGLVGRAVLVSPHLVARRNFALGLGLAFSFFSGVAGFFMIFAVYLQTGRGFEPLAMGLMMLPFAVGAFIASALWAASGRSAGKVPMAIGTILMASGMALALVTIDAVGYKLLAALALSGCGMGLFVVNMFDVAMRGTREADAGAASGLLHTMQQLGNAIGVAVLGAIFFGTLTYAGDHDLAISRVLAFQVALYVLCTVIVLGLRSESSDRAHRHSSA